MTDCPPFGRSGKSFGAFLQSLGRLNELGGGAQGRGRSGRRRRQFDAAELQLIMLKLIIDRPRHGYEIIREIEEMSGGHYIPSPGLIYPTMTLLAEMNMVEEQPGKTARKSFKATGEGEEFAAEKAVEIASLLARLREIGGESASSESRAPIRRAIQNLLTAVEAAIESDRLSSQRVDEITDLLDQTARAIERLR